MAISPRILKAKHKAAADKMEQEIDSDLERASTTDSVVNIEAPRNLTESIFEDLKCRYTKEGWTKVEWIRDYYQQQGDRLKFTA